VVATRAPSGLHARPSGLDANVAWS
jgi:hypothetical protein